MSYIAICDYENYYNRRCLPPQDTFQDYDNYIIDIFEDINFKINDGISTEQVINWKQPGWAFPNYLLVSDDGNTIKSRWYVLESQQTRSGQLKLTLRRDLIADFYEEATTAPAMIERGRLSAYDPYIFNDEGIRFNQIKTDEYLLKDETQIPWIVGYVARKDDETNKTISVNQPQSFDYSGDSVNNWGTTGLNLGYYYRGNAQKTAAGINCSHKILAKNSISSNICYYFTYENNTLKSTVAPSTPIPSLNYPGRFTLNQYKQGLERAFDNTADDLNSAGATTVYINDGAVSLLKSAEGKIVKIGEDTYYRVKLVSQDFTTTIYQVAAATYPVYFNAMSNFCLNTTINDTSNLFSGEANDYSFSLVVKGTQYYLDLEPIEDKIEVVIPSTRRILSDAPYSMFAIPYGSLIITEGPIVSLGIGNEDIATQISSAISRQMSGQIYDIQLLPYCPLRRIISGTNSVSLANITENIDYNFITHNDIKIGFMVWVENSQFTFDINRLELNPYDVKTTNQCITRRLCSPNYSAIYEFNDAKLKGIQGFNIDCAYKPYTPYIHIWPKGGNGSLYGADFNDPRGLICSGDFSMSATQDQWQLYELNNKNYQNMFDRQIETMDLTHSIQKEQEIWQMVMGAIQSGVSAAQTGAYVGQLGGPAAMGISAGVAGAAGLGLSLAAGARDIQLQGQLRENERSQAYDMFRMSNENIQAMPDTLTKVSAFNPNNKIFPVMETYSATEKEISAFQDYIKYRGMTVGRIGTVAEFIWPTEEFVQARIIRFDTLHDDAHVANEINNELMRGVYMKQ